MNVRANIAGRYRATPTPVGEEETGCRPFFASAKAPGLTCFVIRQDNAGQKGGDALADARASHEGACEALS